MSIEGDQFTGICSMTYYIGNILRRSDYGLLLGSEAIGSEAIIGNQFHRQNKWPMPTYGNDGAWITTNESNVITQSIFVIDDSQFTFYPPNISELVNIDWFQPQISNDYDFDCPTPGVEECCENFNIPDTTIDFEVNQEIKNFLLKRQLYQNILFGMMDTAGSITLNNFYLKSDTTDYGKLTKSRWNFIKSVAVTINERADYISAALAQNTSVSGSSDFISYEKSSNELLANYLPEGDLSVLISSEDDIRAIAELCPYEFGSAVYMNRSWLKAIDHEINFDETSECGEIEPRSFMPHKKEGQHLVIHPNPIHINQVFTIELGGTAQQLVISDIYGKVIYTKSKIENEHELKMQLNLSGLYFIRIVDQNYSIRSGRFVVVGN